MSKRNRLSIIIAATLILINIFVLSSCEGEKTAITVAGSTSVQPYAEMLAETFEKRYAELYPESEIIPEIDVQGGGSSLGITMALSHTAHIGMSSRELTDTEEEDLKPILIAKDALTIIVHKNNPVENLSMEQLRGIYTREITNWSEVGGNDAKIHVITREEGSGTRSEFEKSVMDKNPITPKAITQNSNGAVRLLVSQDKYSIGFISLGLVDQYDQDGKKRFDEKVKALMLDGIEANEENVENGSYKLRRQFFFVLPLDKQRDPESLTERFIAFVLSPEGQGILKHEGLIGAGNK